MTNWLDLWPDWARRWFGWTLRISIGISGVVFGALLIFLAYFGASFKQTEPEWGTEEVVILVSGIAVLGTSIWMFARPSKASLALFVAAIAWVFVGLQP